MPLFDHFSLVAPLYDRVIGFRTPDRLLQLLRLPESGCILDAAGGTGRVAAYLSSPGRQVVVADVSTGMLAQAKSKPGLDLTQTSTELLPYESCSFDRILMVDAFHHVADQQKTAAELWRVLKPGGRIVIQEPDIRTLIVKLLAVAENLLLMRSRIISPQRIVKLFPHSAKFSISAEGYDAWIVVEKPVSSEDQAHLVSGL